MSALPLAAMHIHSVANINDAHTKAKRHRSLAGEIEKHTCKMPVRSS
jgi:hypothetical protein